MKTDFMHLFELPEVEIVDVTNADTYFYSTNKYVNAVMNMSSAKMIDIPYVEFGFGKRDYYNFSFDSNYAQVLLYEYGFNNYLYAMIKPKDLVNYNMSELSKMIETTYHFKWDKYRNKKGIIDDSKKIEFLTDIIKYKSKYQCNQ